MLTPEQITLAHVFAMAVSSTMVASVALVVAYDCWRGGHVKGTVKRVGLALFAAGVGLHFWYFTLCWMLIKAGDGDLAHWFYEQVHWTALTGIISTIGACTMLAAVYWHKSRWAGIGLMVAGFSATWMAGLML